MPFKSAVVTAFTVLFSYDCLMSISLDKSLVKRVVVVVLPFVPVTRIEPMSNSLERAFKDSNPPIFKKN